MECRRKASTEIILQIWSIAFINSSIPYYGCKHVYNPPNFVVDIYYGCNLASYSNINDECSDLWLGLNQVILFRIDVPTQVFAIRSRCERNLHMWARD